MRRRALDKADRELLDELYRNSYRVVLSRTTQKLGDHERAEGLLSQVYVALVPQLHKLRRLRKESQVAYIVATALQICDEYLERQKQLEARRYYYNGFELSDLEYLEGLDEEGKQILTEQLNMFRNALSSLPTEDRLHLKQYVLEAETAKREGRSEPALNSSASSALGKITALLGKEGPR